MFIYYLSWGAIYAGTFIARQRGFAVVADEVRTLVSRTSQSTHEITGVIHSIQGMSQSAFELINACSQVVSNKAQDSQSVCELLSLLAEVADDYPVWWNKQPGLPWSKLRLPWVCHYELK
jgi:Methyl-accepting chemotaxis protein (MCP) signalling domain